MEELEEVAQCCPSKLCGCPKGCCKIPDRFAVSMAVVGEILGGADLISDIVLLTVFLKQDTTKRDAFTWILLAIVLVATVFFIWEFYIFIQFVKTRCPECSSKKLTDLDAPETPSVSYGNAMVTVMPTTDAGSMEWLPKNVVVVEDTIQQDFEKSAIETKEKEKKKNITMQREVVSYLLLLVEDLPVQVFTIIFLLTAAASSKTHFYRCELWQEIFNDTWIVNIVMFTAICNSLWKALRSLQYCICCEWYKIQNCCCRFCCCIVRIVRPIFALLLVLLILVDWLLYAFLNETAKCEDTGLITTVEYQLLHSTTENSITMA